MGGELIEQPGVLQTDSILVRTMREDDLQPVVAIDAAASGRRRPRYFQLMLERSVKQVALQASLVAELEGRVVGFVIASLYYGEFGPDYRGQQVGKALMRQLRMNLSALQMTSLRTEVAWDDFELLAFFKQEGFSPARRLCLESPLDSTAPGDHERK
jgi:ribosomal protein S18 acetylase RimI-like enzyme